MSTSLVLEEQKSRETARSRPLETPRMSFFSSGSAKRTKEKKPKKKETHHDVIGRRDRQLQHLFPGEKEVVKRAERDRRGLVAAGLQGRVRRVR